MRKFGITLATIALLLLGGIIFLRYKDRAIKPAPLPPVQSYQAAVESETQNPTATAAEPSLPAEVNLAIPFISQAPHQNWDLPYQEFCEEASVLMAASFIKNENILSPDDADKKMLAIKDFEEKKLGFYKDTSASETATILTEFYGLEKVEVVSDPTEQSLKKALAEVGAKA